jgi:hypothetical protein
VVEVGGIVGFGFFVYQQWIYTAPAIHPNNVLDASSFIMPFSIINRSDLFSITNAELTCGVDLLYFADAEGKTGYVADMGFVTGRFSIPNDGPLAYQCNASQLAEILPDGRLSIRKSMNTKSGVFKPPLRIIMMCLWIGGDYKIWGIVPRRFTSTVFRWPTAKGVNQWIEGPLATLPFKVGDLKDPREDYLACTEPSKNRPYGLFREEGRPAELIFGR